MLTSTHFTDKRLWTLCLTICFFEGSMFLWIFFKFPLLRVAHALSNSPHPRGHDPDMLIDMKAATSLPYGTIFAALMCAMMLGSVLFTWYSTYASSSMSSSPNLPGPTVTPDNTNRIARRCLPSCSSETLLLLTLTLSSLSFCIPTLTYSEPIIFYCFCLFEICVGIYYPVMAGLREKLIEDDDVRMRVYAILRVPLNVFVVVGLGLTRDGTCCWFHFVGYFLLHGSEF